ncbi:MAG: preQ(1) synthase [Endomicrobium sp.]|jgi:7-cyano-7-deazaguanine reductase|nr:preQ(1) synthase [Endomicrobium sp.]
MSKTDNAAAVIFDKVSPQILEVMPYQYEGQDINVCIDTEEFTCLCPWTGLPDFARMSICYTPDKTVVELKSLKMYLQSYRNVGIVHESAVNSILNDLAEILKPKYMNVDMTFRIRGGITTSVNAEYKKD